VKLKIVIALLALGLAGYPLLVYQLTSEWSVKAPAILLCVILSVRWLLTKGWQHRRDSIILTLGLSLGIAALTLQNVTPLKLYPILMNLGVSFIFGVSLLRDETILERFAGRMTDIDSAQGARSYLRVLTGIWAALLLFNALFSAYTACCTSLEFWALYNAVYVYIIMAGLFLLELIFRWFFKRRMETTGNGRDCT